MRSIMEVLNRREIKHLAEIAKDNRQMVIEFVGLPEVDIASAQRVLNKHLNIARDPAVREAMRAKKGRPPVTPQQA